MPKAILNKLGVGTFVLTGLIILSWIIPALRDGLTIQYGEDISQLAGFFRWISGYGLIAGILIVAGWLNFRFPLRLVERSPHLKWYYRTWILVLASLIFVGLQRRTYFEIEWIEENLLVTLLSLAVILSVTKFASLVRGRNQQALQLQSQTSAELQALRSQINPHFLFNALNTLYSRSLKVDDEVLSTQIHELSAILRFTLSQGQQERIPLQEEADFLEKYINLQRARFTSSSVLEVSITFEDPEALVPPLLILPLVENLFVHGVLSEQIGQMAEIRLWQENSQLYVVSRNYFSEKSQRVGTGQGISNVRRRLELMFPGQHQFSMRSENSTFEVFLTIPLLQPKSSLQP